MIIRGKIVPKYVIYQNKKYLITYVSKSFIMPYFKIVLGTKEKIKKVIINKHHPNAINFKNPSKPPEKVTGDLEYCLSSTILGSKFNTDSIRKIKESLQTYDFDECYWKHFNNVKFDEEKPICTIFDTSLLFNTY
jgi:hypothetical protein